METESSHLKSFVLLHNENNSFFWIAIGNKINGIIKIQSDLFNLNKKKHHFGIQKIIQWEVFMRI